jgi:hypothetical protein
MKAYKQQTTLGWNHFVRGRMNIEWGDITNNHLATKPNHSFNAEHWGAKLIAIHWKHMLELWSIRNQEVHGETPEQTEEINRTTMIAEIIDIQQSHQHLPISSRELISRDKTSLQDMPTPSLSLYLYGAIMLAESAKKHPNKIETRPISKFFQPRSRLTTKEGEQSQQQEEPSTI